MGTLRENRARPCWLVILAGLVLIGCGSVDATAKQPGAEATSAEAGPAATATEDGNPHVWKPRTRSVAVFKNGLGFFIREGKVKLRDGWCMAREIPPATFGTLALYARDEKETVDIVGTGPGEVVEFDGRDAGKEASVKRARLEASQGLKVELTYTHKGQDRSAAGELVSVGPRFAVLESGSNSFAVPVEGVKRMQVLETPMRLHVASTAAEPAPETTLGMGYLRKGITWIPDYTLKVLDDKTAELTLRGTLVNEAEDLIHTDVHLVVGVPHFVHTQYMAPIAVGQVIRAIGMGMEGGSLPQAVTSQMMSRAAVVSNIHGSPQLDRPASVVNTPIVPGGGNLSKALGNLPQLGGAAATDYTVYTKQDLTLRRGEKAILTLLVKKISYTHIYRWSPPTRMQHSFVLHNQTDTAWTTGPCLAISAERPLSEDLLRYTPKGGRGELPVTTAINVAHDKGEGEIERKLKAHSPRSNTHYDLVTLEGKLKLRNFEKRDVEIVITNPVPGKPIMADGRGVMSVDPTKLKLLERAGSVRWTVKLEPGEEKTLIYQYERYVPSH